MNRRELIAYVVTHGSQPEPPTTMHPVGGKIFFIDDTAAGATYHFYDSSGNEIQDISVGDEPTSYSVEGTPTKDKFYVFNNQLLTSKVWTYQQDGDWVYNLLGTSTDVGQGRNNTDIVMAADEGKYVAQSNSIWHYLDIANTTDKPGGCDDWFVPSKDEADKLRLAVDSDGNTLVTWFTNNYIWSSSENNNVAPWYWHYSYQAWSYYYKNDTNGVFWTRSF